MRLSIPGIHQSYTFAITVIVSVIILWLGSLLIFFPGLGFDSAYVAVVGIGLILTSVFMFGTVKGIGLAPFVAIAIVGIYACARAGGGIEYAWLARIIGILIWLTVPFLLYLTWPYRKPDEPDVPGPPMNN